MKVAIVADWLYGGGAERVVEELHHLYPQAPIYASYCSKEWRKKLGNKVITGYLQHTPFRQLRRFLPLLRQWWFRSLDLSKFDVIISSSGNGESKFVTIKKPAIHICYCHTPTHFYWRHYQEYLKNPSFRPQWLARIGLRLLAGSLRKRDFEAAQKVDFFIANSNHIREDIKKYYNRDSEVIHPPVAVGRFSAVTQPQERKGFVTLGRQVPFKKTDLIVEACKELNVPLTVIGNGPEHSKLVSQTGPTIHFKTNISDEDMPHELASAEGFLFAAYEDFGVAPVEAMATGTPVIAYKAGGAKDYVKPGKTGEFFDKQTAESLIEVLKKFKPGMYKVSVLQNNAKQFSEVSFRSRIEKFVEDKFRV